VEPRSEEPRPGIQGDLDIHRRINGGSPQPPTSAPANAPPPWPPPLVEAQRLRMVPEREAPLELAPSSLPVPEPEFTPTRLPLQAHRQPEEERTVQAVVYDRKNPSGRTRRDRVLRPNEQERAQEQVARRLRAAACGLLAVAATTPVLASPSAGGWILMAVGGALAGVAALETMDSEVSWGITMAILGSLLGVFYGPAGLSIFQAMIAGLVFGLSGWLTGKLREIHHLG
jgi:hypothetical protein